MPTVTIEKAENGYIMKLNGKVYIADCFGDAMYKCAIAFDEKEVIAMRNEIESDGNKNAKIIRAHGHPDIIKPKQGRKPKATKAK